MTHLLDRLFRRGPAVTGGSRSHLGSDTGFTTGYRRSRHCGLVVSAFTDEAVRVHKSAHLSDRLIAEAVGAKPSTVRDWLSGRSSPTGERARRLAELAEITDRLARVVDAGYIPVWMLKPVEALDDRTPTELIAAGESRQVARFVSSLESPGAA